MTFATALSDARNRLGLSEKAAARRLNMRLSFYLGYEHGAHDPSFSKGVSMLGSLGTRIRLDPVPDPPSTDAEVAPAES